MSSDSAFLGRFSAAHTGGRRASFAFLALIHLAALALFVWSDIDPIGFVTALLTWALVNFVFLIVLRRPMVAAALTLMLAVILILLSRFKHGILMMTVNFLDVLIV